MCYTTRVKTKEEPLNRLQELTHELTVALVENLQTQYDEGNFISQDVVHQTATELFEESDELVSMIHEDDMADFLLDDVIHNIAINL